LGDIALQLGGMIGGISGVDADLDESRREYRVELQMRDGITFSSRVISDGTLRILALLALLHDPRRRGLIFFEEPENGIHPARVRKLVEILREMVTDVFPGRVDDESPDGLQPLGQLLLNSHSPVVLAALVNDDLEAVRGSILFADMVSVMDREKGHTRRKSRFRPVRMIREDERQQDVFADPTAEPTFVSDIEVAAMLDTVGQEA